eukprot:6385722-Pyramimonas_sp.AAC.2
MGRGSTHMVTGLGYGPKSAHGGVWSAYSTMPSFLVTLYTSYLYLGEWNPRVWDMSEVYNPMYRDTRLV